MRRPGSCADGGGFLRLGGREGAWGERSFAAANDNPRSTPADKERPLGSPACHVKARVEDGALGWLVFPVFGGGVLEFGAGLFVLE